MTNSLLAVFIVLGVVAVLAWLAQRGTFAGMQPRNRIVVVETAVPLGERRSLVVVAVEGRRLLLGATPGQVVLITELSPAPPDAVVSKESGMNNPDPVNPFNPAPWFRRLRT